LTPRYFLVKEASLLGPQTIAPGETYSFRVVYEIAADATDGDSQVTLKVKTLTPNTVPKPPDGA